MTAPTDAEVAASIASPPCPFCGKTPRWLHSAGSWGYNLDRRAFGCDNADCAIQPRTRWRHLESWQPGKGTVPVNLDALAVREWSACATILDQATKKGRTAGLREAAVIVRAQATMWRDEARGSWPISGFAKALMQLAMRLERIAATFPIASNQEKNHDRAE